MSEELDQFGNTLIEIASNVPFGYFIDNIITIMKSKNSSVIDNFSNVLSLIRSLLTCIILLGYKYNNQMLEIPDIMTYLVIMIQIVSVIKIWLEKTDNVDKTLDTVENLVTTLPIIPGLITIEGISSKPIHSYTTGILINPVGDLVEDLWKKFSSDLMKNYSTVVKSVFILLLSIFIGYRRERSYVLKKWNSFILIQVIVIIIRTLKAINKIQNEKKKS